MAEIIRQGDATSHGGKVLEGSPFDICMGKPIAFVGHKVSCPQCKGIFPIVEGAPFTIFYGKGVALAGMKTACGAVLIPSQFTDTVDGGGGASTATSSKTHRHVNVDSARAVRASGSTDASATGQEGFNESFKLIDDITGAPLPYTDYAIRRAFGDIEHGVTDADGCTHLLAATASAELIDVYV